MLVYNSYNQERFRISSTGDLGIGSVGASAYSFCDSVEPIPLGWRTVTSTSPQVAQWIESQAPWLWVRVTCVRSEGWALDAQLITMLILKFG